MAIQIVFSLPQPTSLQRIVVDKLRVCYDAIRFFQKGLFFPEEVEVWFNAPSEALGGTLARVTPSKNPLEATDILYQYLMSLPYDDLRKTIIIFRGIWEFDDIRLGGYFSVHNKYEWRKVYGDLEISAYAKGEVQDLVDAFWETQNIEGLVPKFIQALQHTVKDLSINLRQVTFCRGIWSKEDPASIMAVYLVGERRGLLRLFYNALRHQKDPTVLPRARPLNTNFLVQTLADTKIVEERIAKRLEKDLVMEIQKKSALYIAKRSDSFGKLFIDIADAILKPALAELPNEDHVKEQIEHGLKGYFE